MSAAPPADRVAVVTGATSGIGREVARALARQRFRVVVVGRDSTRCERVASEIAQTSGNGRVDWLSVDDLALRSECRAVALELARRYPAIHLLVNNAGAYFARRDVTADGVERTLALNVLAPLLLTLGLERPLRAAAPSRVVNVASAAHHRAQVDLADLEGAVGYRGFRAYSRSKLELILLTRELARQFRGSGVSVVAVHPGLIASGFGLNNGGAVAAGVWLASRAFGRNVRVGAARVVGAATDPRVRSGDYLSGGRTAPGSAESRDMATASRLYAQCLRYLGGGTPAGVTAPA
jgi:retinol dehydrogenase 12